MSQYEHEQALWSIWRHNRLSELTHPFGWTSLVAQHWLHEGETQRTLEGLPGTWSFSEGKVLHSPSPSPDLETMITVDGVAQVSPFVLPQVRSLSAHPRTAPVVLSGSREVETLMRSTHTGASSVAIRVRDPRTVASARTLSLPAFSYNPDFRVASTFVPHDPIEVVRETVAHGIIDVVQSIGTLHFTLHGRDHSLIVFGRPSPTGIEPFTHVRDASSGSLTHEIGRSITLHTSDATGTAIDVVDFNYLHSMPCAFTPFVSCPLAIKENVLDIALLSGEKTPAVAREDADHQTRT